MADSILRLKVESAEYDSKLKKASQGLQHYIDNCRKVGGTLAVVEDDTLAFVKTLGDMPTMAQGGTQSLREMTRSITDLTMQYRSLTDKEKNSPFGQAMAASIQTLTSRAGEARDAIDDVQATIKHAASDTRVFDQIASAAGLATASFQTLQGASKLLGIDIGDNVEVIAKLQAAMAVTNGLTQIQTALQKESALMQGLTAAKTTIAAAAQELYAVATGKATAAQAELNAVAQASPYVWIGTAIIAAATALNHFSKEAQRAAAEDERLEKRQEEASRQADNMRQSFVNASAQAMNTASRLSNLQAAYAAANSEIEKTAILSEAADEFKKLGLACKNLSEAQNILVNNGSAVIEMLRIQGNVAALSALRMEEYKKSFSTLLSNGYDVEAASILAGYNSTVQQFDDQITKAQSRIQAIQKGLPMSGGASGNVTAPAADNKNLPVGSVAQLTQQLKELQTAQSLVTDNREWNRYQQQIEQVQYQIDALKGSWKDGLQATFTIDADNTEALARIGEIEGATIADKTVMVTAHNAEALAQLAEIQGVTISDKTVTVQADTADAYNKILELTKDIDGTTVTFQVKPEIERGIGKSITTSAGLSDFISSIKSKLQNADFGSDLYRSLTEKLADATMLESLVKESLSVGLGTALFDIADETGQDFWDRVLSPEGVENADWQAIADAINRKRKEMGLDAITLDFNTGNTSKASSNKTNTDDKIEDHIKASNDVTNALGEVSSGLNQMGIELPDSVNRLINGFQGLISVINGINTLFTLMNSTVVPSEITAINANTLAVAANTAAQTGRTVMEGAEVAADVIKIAAVAAMAHGGIVPKAAHGFAVPGTHYSGDQTPILANAGEIVLSRAQAGNLASQLQDAPIESNKSGFRPYVTGQEIFLGLNNYLNSSSHGEIVTTKMLKNMGVL